MAISGVGNSNYANDVQGSVSLPNSSRTDNKEDYSKILEQYRKQIEEKIKNGDTETTYQIGGQSFTEKEWNKLMEKMDKNIAVVQEDLEEREKKQKMQKENA